MKIIFMGTPDFAAESLKAIYEAGHEILSVVTNPDRPKGRGMKLIATPVRKKNKNISTTKSKRKHRIYRRNKKPKTRCNMCSSIWKNIAKRNFRNT